MIKQKEGVDFVADVNALFQQFRSAAREQVRLPLAVQAYFSGEASPEQMRELEGYLRRRIRSLLELLICEDEVPKLEALAEWLNPGVAGGGLDVAIRQKKAECYVWLLKWKAEHCGFADRDFSM